MVDMPELKSFQTLTDQFISLNRKNGILNMLIEWNLFVVRSWIWIEESEDTYVYEWSDGTQMKIRF